jgi:hypothetical protein
MNPSFELLLALALCVLLLGLWLGLGIGRRRVSARANRARRMGARGEARALRLLERAGYRIEDEQVTGYSELVVDGERRRFTVRADAIVTRRRRRYVAELKGGPKAADIGQRVTRRQVLEYLHAFECDAVLLVDALEGEIHRIEL